MSTIVYVFAFLTSLSAWGQSLWVWCHFFFARPPIRSEAAKVYVAVTRWPLLVSSPLPALENFQMLAHSSNGWGMAGHTFGVLLNLYVSWTMWKTRHDDDDFWRKAKKKLGSVVRVVGGRLVVVPAPAPARI